MLSERYRETLKSTEIDGKTICATDTLAGMLADCEFAGQAAGALMMLERLTPHLSPGAFQAGKALVLALKEKSDESIKSLRGGK